ncbi:unnamed protein product, partial [Mesorhabditis spiculigera]
MPKLTLELRSILFAVAVHAPAADPAYLADALELINEDNQRQAGDQSGINGGPENDPFVDFDLNSQPRLNLPPPMMAPFQPPPVPPYMPYGQLPSTSQMGTLSSPTVPFDRMQLESPPAPNVGTAVRSRPQVYPVAPMPPRMPPRLSHMPMPLPVVEDNEPTTPRQRLKTYGVGPSMERDAPPSVPIPSPPPTQVPSLRPTSPIPIHQMPPPSTRNFGNWCHIQYYEERQEIGAPFSSNDNVVYVDGYSATNESDRFSLGTISFAKSDTMAVEIRQQIGEGFKLTRMDDMVEVQVIGDMPIFVQMPLMSWCSGDHPWTVYRLSKGAKICVHRDSVFQKKLDSLKMSYKAVFRLQSFCIVKIAFLKGFGKDYRRQNIESTPCWVAVNFQSALQQIDKVLRSFQVQEELCTSFS